MFTKYLLVTKIAYKAKGVRFILAVPKCSLKPLPKSITAVFKIRFNQIENYNDWRLFFSGINIFGTILNSQPFIKGIHDINR